MMHGRQRGNRQPLGGRSNNTMHTGHPQHKRKTVDSVQSLNEIAVRDAQELEQMLKIQRELPISSQLPSATEDRGAHQQYNRAPKPAPEGMYHRVPQEYPVPMQERSFSLHTAPMPSLNAGPFDAGDLYATPAGDNFPYWTTFGPSSNDDMPQKFDGTLGAGRLPSSHGPRFLDQTAFDGDQTFDGESTFVTKQQPTLLRKMQAPPWASVPAQQMPFSPGELCDYAPVSQRPVASLNAPLSPPPAPPEPKEEEDITISFKPKVQLQKGSTVSQVRLVLADFEGADADYIKLDSVPARAFIGAYWTSKTKELALILGDDVPAHTSVTITIPASSGIRRVQVDEESVASSATSGSSQDSSASTETEQTQTPMTSDQPAARVDSPAPVANTDGAVPMQLISGEHEALPEEAVPEKQYGIDMELVWSGSEEAFVIAEIVRGGAAWKNGLINEGNVVTHVDEIPLEGQSTQAVNHLLLGVPSTSVILTVRDHVDPLSGQVQTRDVKVTRYDTVEMTIDFYDEEEFCDIPEVEEVHSDAVSQAEWARRQLAQAPKEVTKMVDLNDISKKVSDQSKAAKEQLQTRSSIVKTEYNAASVAEQARWAKDQLENRKDITQRTLIDSDMVAEQKSSALAALANLPQKQVEKKFDAQSVSEQAQWAKKQLENRPDVPKTVMVDTASIQEQAKWAKQKLLAKEQGAQDQDESASQEQPGLPCSDDVDARGGDALDALCRLAGLDDLPSMAQVVAPPVPAPAPDGPPAAIDEEKEKKRRAMQKRLEFLAQAEANKSANDSTASQQLSEAALQQQTVAPALPAIILAPSPVSGESAGTSPSPEPQAPALSVQQQQGQPQLKPRTSSLAGRLSGFGGDLNSSALQPVKSEEELQFQGALGAKKVVA